MSTMGHFGLCFLPIMFILLCQGNGLVQDSNLRDCYPGEWACPGAPLCVAVSKVCDGHADCPNGADETNETAQLTCSYDDCNIWGICDHFCEDRQGTHHCSCADGYFLEQGHICRAYVADGLPQLIFSNGQDVMMAGVQGEYVKTLAQSENKGQAMGVAFHWHSRRVFWTDTVNNKVFSVNFDGGDLMEVLSLAANSPENIAVDWINFKLYVVESSEGRIELCDFSGENRVTLIGENLIDPHGLALDSTVGYMFFSDKGYNNQDAKLERAFMDGSNRVDLVKTGLGAPSGITLDIVTQRVYWADSRFDVVETVTYNGLERKTVLNGGTQVPHPYGLSVFENHVFFTDWTKMGVVQANRFNGSNPKLLYRTTSRPGHIVVSHGVLQPVVKNPCGQHNGGCHHICVLSHRTDNNGLGFSCKCRPGYDLQPDRHTCSKLTDFLLVPTQTAVRGIPLNLSMQEDVTLPLSGLGATFLSFAVEYDGNEEAIFYNDRSWSLIYKAAVNGTSQQILTGYRVGTVRAMAYDWTSKVLFWISSFDQSVVAFKVMDKSRRDIVTGLKQPYGIAVHPTAGYLFWSETQGPAVIMRAFLDGSNATPIINTSLSLPTGLAIDYMLDRIYWADPFLNTIEHADLDGQDRQTISNITGIPGPFFLTIHSDHLYVSTERSGMFRMGKRDGGNILPIRQGIRRIFNIKAYTASLHSTFHSKCSSPVPNGNCSHFCFPTPSSSRVCGCPYGMKLQENQRDCVKDGSVPPPDTSCKSDSFPCDEGRCIPKSYRCDGKRDCIDNTDETNCTNIGMTCSPRAFTCGNKRCIPYTWRCDGEDDCGDGTDEDNCPTQRPTCVSSDFACDNGNCVPMTWVCDANNDCGDGSDERDCTCSSYSCSFDSTCIQLSDGFTCQCFPGSFFSEGSCRKAKVFRGDLRLRALQFQDGMEDTTSKIFQETANRITTALAAALSNDTSYIESKVLQLRKGIIASVDNIYKLTSTMTQGTFGTTLKNSVKLCGDACAILKDSLFKAVDLCQQRPAPCNQDTTNCKNYYNGIVICDCMPGYIRSNFSDRSCSACPSGQKAENDKCVPCPFGYAGFNCNDSSLLAVVVISCFLAILLLVLICNCCSTRKTSNVILKGEPIPLSNTT